MNFTFGIITAGGNDVMISEIITSIHKQNIQNYEIIIVGNSAIEDSKTRVIPFDESQKKGWITRKKNIINQEAQYEFICHLHDYVILCDGWYDGLLKHKSDLNFGITRILTKEGRRFRDFCVFPFFANTLFQKTALVPYHYKPSAELNKIMYVSGSYFIIRKSIALKFPLNEYLTHCNSEDVELSQRITDAEIPILCISESCVQFLKPKCQCEWEVDFDPSIIEKIPKEELLESAQMQRESIKETLRMAGFPGY